jgi:hypothetical protein
MRLRLALRLRRLSLPLCGVAAGSVLLLFACSDSDYVYATSSGPGASSGISSSSGTSSGSSSGFFPDDASAGDFPAQVIVKSTLTERDPDASISDAGAPLDAGPDGCSGLVFNVGDFGPPASPIVSGHLFDGGRGKAEINCSVFETRTDEFAVSGTVRIGNGEFIIASTVKLDQANNDADLLIRPEGVGGPAWSWNNCTVSYPAATPVAARRAWLKIKCGVSTGFSRPFCGVEAEVRLENCLQNSF